jgi:hypothetical protein
MTPIIIPMPIMMPIVSGGGGSPDELLKVFLALYIVSNIISVLIWTVRLIIWSIRKNNNFTMWQYVITGDDGYFFTAFLNTGWFLLINGIAVICLFTKIVYDLL